MTDAPSDRHSGPTTTTAVDFQALVGEVVADRYRVKRLIAAGGMGAVYLGEHLHLRHEVAIKILHQQVENLPELAARFEREAMVGAHLRHANIASATDFGRLADGSCFLVQEFAPGETLRAILTRGPIQPWQALEIVREVGRALAAAHELGVVHRDIKPSNIVVAERPGGQLEVKLLDFGLAKVDMSRLADGRLLPDSGRLTAEGMVMGTPTYMAPEAALGMNAVDERSDLYSLGLILFEMLSGKRPFRGQSETAQFRRKLECPPPTFAQVAPTLKIPPALEALTRRLLELTPSLRFENGTELVSALQTIALDAPPDSVAPDSNDDESTSPCSRDARRLNTEKGLDSRRAGVLAFAATAVLVGLVTWLVLIATSPSPGAAVTAGAETPSVPNAAHLELASSVLPARDSAAAAGGASQPPGGRTAVGMAASSDGPPPEKARLLAHELRIAEKARDWQTALRTFHRLAELHPQSFQYPANRRAAASLFSALAGGPETSLSAMRQTLEASLGSGGPDVLFEVVLFRGGSVAHELAVDSLQKPAVVALATPELRVALKLRELGCQADASFLDEVIRLGDGRALVVMNAQAGCGPSKARDQAFRELEARLSRR